MLDGLSLPVVIIVQARMGATRLPQKPLLQILNKPMIEYQIERLKRVKEADQLIFAIPKTVDNEGLGNFLQKYSEVFRGEEEDVLDRYYRAALHAGAKTIVRITGDCPLIDPDLIDETIVHFLNSGFDYYSNTLNRTYPRGMDVEVFTLDSLKTAFENAKDKKEREHVTPYIYFHPELFKIGQLIQETNESSLRLTVDTPDDFRLIRCILEDLYPKNPYFSLGDVLMLLKKNPEWLKINQHIKQKPL